MNRGWQLTTRLRRNDNVETKRISVSWIWLGGAQISTHRESWAGSYLKQKINNREMGRRG